MDGRSATLGAIGVAIAGILAFLVLEGVAAGLALLVAGVLLVVIGMVGWRDRRPALATAVVEGTAMPEIDPVTLVGDGDGSAPLDLGETDPVLDLEPDTSQTVDRDYAPTPEPTLQLFDAGSLDHLHDRPLLGHGDLAGHVRDYHEEIPSDGSTIQLRLLHERAHGAPHELPVNLKTS